MNHLIITIDLPVDERLGRLDETEAEEAAKQAYKAARRALTNFTKYDEDDVTFKIET